MSTRSEKTSKSKFPRKSSSKGFSMLRTRIWDDWPQNPIDQHLTNENRLLRKWVDMMFFRSRFLRDSAAVNRMVSFNFLIITYVLEDAELVKTCSFHLRRRRFYVKTSYAMNSSSGPVSSHFPLFSHASRLAFLEAVTINQSETYTDRKSSSSTVAKWVSSFFPIS